jgi:hypothetical protein
VNGDPSGGTTSVDPTENIEAISSDASAADAAAEVPSANEVAVETPAPEAPSEEEVAAPRGFLSRLFGKGADY